MNLEYKCPICGKKHNIINTRQSKVVWTRNKHLQRTNGIEYSITGELKCSCPDTTKHPRSIKIKLEIMEYPKGIARQQFVYIGAYKMENIDISLLCSYIRFLKPQAHPMKLTMTNKQRNISDYYILDSMAIKSSLEWINRFMKKFNISVIVSISGNTLQSKVITKKKESFEIFPACVSSCMNKNTKEAAVSYSKDLYKAETSLKKKLDELRTKGKEVSQKNSCGYKIGHCAENNAANVVLTNTRCSLDDLIFSLALRPRTLQVIDPYQNCSTVFNNL